ncbi:hypothetical protein HDZ31DRAFT_77689 [Schizophyllum fasciatum]
MGARFGAGAGWVQVRTWVQVHGLEVRKEETKEPPPEEELDEQLELHDYKEPAGVRDERLRKEGRRSARNELPRVEQELNERLLRDEALKSGRARRAGRPEERWMEEEAEETTCEEVAEELSSELDELAREEICSGGLRTLLRVEGGRVELSPKDRGTDALATRWACCAREVPYVSLGCRARGPRAANGLHSPPPLETDAY